MPEQTPLEASPISSSSLTGLGGLCAAVVGLWLFMHLVTPWLVELIPPLREHTRIVSEDGLIPGALYYTDIPQTIDGEFNNRDTIRYFVGKGN